VRELFRFPDPVNESSARIVATGVVLLVFAFVVFREGWLLVPLVYGFVARALTGPSLSPLGQLATRVVTPRLNVEHRFVPGPPKRFAQAIGVAFSGGAALAWLLGAPAIAGVLLVGLIVAATLESVFAICLGCVVYNAFWGCDDCANLSERLRASLAEVTASN
jgi:hypothetical protein